jgi:uncharacterized protein YcbK (DUF882 family)
MDLARRRLVTGAGALSAAAAAVAAAAAPMLLGKKAASGPGSAPALLPAAPLRLPRDIAPTAARDARRVLVHNLHTGERLDAVYFENGKYVSDALSEAMRVLRDWRNGAEHFMDPRLFDVMHGVRQRLGAAAPFQIISGYRSPQTNEMLHERSGQVAAHSQHVLGKAADVRIQGVALEDLHKAALSLGAGGVGFYPVSNFVHMDVGRVRHWMGS